MMILCVKVVSCCSCRSSIWASISPAREFCDDLKWPTAVFALCLWLCVQCLGSRVWLRGETLWSFEAYSRHTGKFTHSRNHGARQHGREETGCA